MKRKALRWIFTVALAVMAILPGCSGARSNSLSADAPLAGGESLSSSHELDVVSAPEYNSTSWAKVYHDYLSTFEPVTYTSAVYGSTHTVAGRMVGAEKIACMGIEFQNFDGYDYPVLVCWDGSAIDADGYMDGFEFIPTIYLIENESLVQIDFSSPNWQTFINTDEVPEAKGSGVAMFSFKPENDGGPQNIQKALEWLEAKM